MALVITGAKAILKLSGDALAFCTGVSVNHENRLEEIPQLDSLEVAEYAENGHRCSITVSTIKLSPSATIGGTQFFNSASAFGFDPQNDLREILLQPEIIIEIVETGTDPNVDSEKSIYVGFGAKFEGGSGQVDARGIWTGSWNFKCRRGTGI